MLLSSIHSEADGNVFCFVFSSVPKRPLKKKNLENVERDKAKSKKVKKCIM